MAHVSPKPLRFADARRVATARVARATALARERYGYRSFTTARSHSTRAADQHHAFTRDTRARTHRAQHHGVRARPTRHRIRPRGARARGGHAARHGGPLARPRDARRRRRAHRRGAGGKKEGGAGKEGLSARWRAARRQCPGVRSTVERATARVRRVGSAPGFSQMLSAQCRAARQRSAPTPCSPRALSSRGRGGGGRVRALARRRVRLRPP